MKLYVKFDSATDNVLGIHIAMGTPSSVPVDATAASLAVVTPATNRGVVQVKINDVITDVSIEKVMTNIHELKFNTQAYLYTDKAVDDWTDSKISTLDGTAPLSFIRANTIVNFGRL